MAKTVNFSLIRALNQRAILDAVCTRESVSRAELARQLHMSKPAMGAIVAELLDQGLMEELGEGNCGEGGGRKPLLLRFKKDHKFIISIDFYYKSSIFVLCNIMGDIVNRIELQQSPNQDFQVWLHMASNAICTLLNAQNISDCDLAAIGISSPGVIGPSGPIISSRQFGDFDSSVLRSTLAQKFNCPIYIKNSTNASALGEWYLGAGQGVQNMIYISYGQGLGAGLILEKKLYEGSRWAAGEVAGFVTPETYASKKTLEERICIAGLLEQVRQEAPKETIQKFDGAITFETLVSVWKQQDPYLVSLIDKVGLELGCMVSNLIMACNCDLVVLGGEGCAFKSQLLKKVTEIVQRCCIIPARITTSTLGVNASSVGIVNMCRELYFDRICGLTPNIT